VRCLYSNCKKGYQNIESVRAHVVLRVNNNINFKLKNAEAFLRSHDAILIENTDNIADKSNFQAMAIGNDGFGNESVIR
jgi:archaellum component FlaF (FlaF/FlaG flagellin family)